MSLAFVICRDALYRMLLTEYLREARGYQVEARGLPSRADGQLVRNWVDKAYRELADWLEDRAAGPARLRQALAFIDLHYISDLAPRKGSGEGSFSPQELDPMRPEASSTAPWSAILAALVLSFPEVHWVFLTPSRHDFAGRPDLFQRAHLAGLANPVEHVTDLSADGFTPLFDPAGLRNLIHENISRSDDRKDLKGPGAHPTPRRKDYAVAIDDEQPYAYFLAYIAYRFGYLSHAVTTRRMMGLLLGEESLLPDKKPKLAFADIYLNFSDGIPGEHLCDLKGKREKVCPALKEAAHRVFVSVGRAYDLDPETDKYCKELEKAERGRRLGKPLSGMFAVRIASKMPKATLYEWPPPSPPGVSKTGPHSAPGRILVIAERLIRRAQALTTCAHSVQDAIHGAVLALEAEELLGCRTPTTALEALDIRQQFEVEAECMFYGIQANFEVASRFHDIYRIVAALSTCFKRDEQQSTRAQAAIGVINQLMLRFRAANQFDEELACLREVRRLYSYAGKSFNWYLELYKVKAESRFALPPALRDWLADRLSNNRLSGLFRRYFNILAGSVITYMIVILGLVFAFSFAYWCCGPQGDAYPFLKWLAYSAITMFGLGIPDATTVFGVNIIPCTCTCPNGFLVSLVAELVLGYVHLGIFVSTVYTKLARR